MIPKETDNGTKLIINSQPKISKGIDNTRFMLEKIKQDIMILSAKRDLLIEVIWNLEKIEGENT